MKMTNKTSCYKYHEYIDEYINRARSGENIVGKDILKAMDLIESQLNQDNVFIDSDKIYDAKRVMETDSGITLFDWQKLVVALIHCYYKDSQSVVFPEILLFVGRGAGKNKFVSELARYLSSPNHGVEDYNIEITANNEKQAKTSFMDVHKTLKNNAAKMKRFFTWSLTSIRNKQTNSTIEYHTSNARTKDGLRPGCVIFDEIHEYENYDTISVFTSALGKVPYDRTIYITTNGYVRDGVLDKELERAEAVLEGKEDPLGFLPLLYRLDDDEEVHDEDMWHKANPSLKYLPNLHNRIQREYNQAKRDETVYIELMTKRMNRPKQDTFSAVASWEDIKAASEIELPLDELEGKECIGGLDYAEVQDFASCGLLFKMNGKRYWLEHTFVCHKALSLESREIKFPVREMAERGLITIINDESIQPYHIADWFSKQREKYNIRKIVADDFRMRYVKQEFEERGFPIEIVRSGPITHGRVAPIISSMFANREIVWGDNPTMNWYTNNTYKELDNKGNTGFYKIEPRLRKTDGFFALLHAISVDDELKEPKKIELLMPVI